MLSHLVEEFNLELLCMEFCWFSKAPVHLFWMILWRIFVIFSCRHSNSWLLWVIGALPCLATVVWYVICLYYSNIKDFWKFSDQRFKEKLRIQTQLIKYSYVESVNDAWTIQENRTLLVIILYSLFFLFSQNYYGVPSQWGWSGQDQSVQKGQ